MASQYHSYLAGLVAEESESDYLRELFMDEKDEYKHSISDLRESGIRETKYLRFVEDEEVNLMIVAGIRKTKVVTVWSKQEEDTVLGEIMWFPAWRTYVFESAPEHLIFDARCLQDILEYIQWLLYERKMGMGKNKEKNKEKDEDEDDGNKG